MIDTTKSVLTNLLFEYAHYEYEEDSEGEIANSIIAKIKAEGVKEHEQNKPKPEPVAFIIHSKDAGFWCVETLEEAERIAISLDGARFEPLYNATPTREPLSDEQIIEIADKTQTAESGENGYILPVAYAREIEKAHGIGVEK